MLGSIYALIALGYTMVYGILRIINFAHGDILMVGALTTLSAMNALNTTFPHMPQLLQLGVALMIAMAVCALLAMAVERFAYRRLRNAPAPRAADLGYRRFGPAANRGDDYLDAQPADVPADPADGPYRCHVRQRSASSWPSSPSPVSSPLSWRWR